MWMLLSWLMTVAVAADGEPVRAPPLDVAAWIAQGPAADAETPLIVVEVWATWCGPCHATFPMLSRLQEAYGDQIRVVALTDDSAPTARRFFHDNADQMRIAVAVASDEVVQAFMFGGFGGRGLPSVYVIEDGRMVWSGAPDALQAALLERLGAPPLAEAVPDPR